MKRLLTHMKSNVSYMSQ